MRYLIIILDKYVKFTDKNYYLRYTFIASYAPCHSSVVCLPVCCSQSDLFLGHFRNHICPVDLPRDTQQEISFQGKRSFLLGSRFRSCIIYLFSKRRKFNIELIQHIRKNDGSYNINARRGAFYRAVVNLHDYKKMEAIRADSNFCRIPCGDCLFFG